jgi:hypothetical protein
MLLTDVFGQGFFSPSAIISAEACDRSHGQPLESGDNPELRKIGADRIESLGIYAASFGG